MTRLAVILIPLLVLSLGLGLVGCGGGDGEAGPAGPVVSARGAALQTDLSLVQGAVDAYVIQSFSVPTGDGKVPPAGEYAPIDFFASFTEDGETLSLYPDFIIQLPRHHDEGVWRIDSAMEVSVAVAPEDY
jgi:hypothetical protein